MKDKTNFITLQPGDYIQLQVGLKVQNVGKNVISFEMPDYIEVMTINSDNATVEFGLAPKGKRGMK